MIVLAAGPDALSRLMASDRVRRCGRADQASSTATATASPPPMHRLATPFVPPRA